MTQSKPYTIAFLANTFHSEYCHIMYSGIQKAVSELGVSLVTISGGDLECPDYNDARRNRVFDLVDTSDYDGIVFQSGSLHNYTTDENFLKFCSQYDGIPSVHIGFKKDGHSSVIVDNKTGMGELIDHFIEVHNRKEIAFISGPVGCTDADERLDAYKESLKKHGIPFREELVYKGTFIPDSGQMAVREFLDVRKIKFDAMVGANDQMALFGMNELIRRGFRVPADIIIGGFDDLISARASSPGLCTVRQPVQELGKEALKLLIDIIDGTRKTGTSITLPSRLVLRRSCGCISVPFSGFDNCDNDDQGVCVFEKQFDSILQKSGSTALEFLENQIITHLKSGESINDLLSIISKILDKNTQQISGDLQNKIWRILLTISEEYYSLAKVKQQETDDQLYIFIDDMRKVTEADDLRSFLNTYLSEFKFKRFFISRYKDNDSAELFFSSIPDDKITVYNAKKLIPGGLKSLQAQFNLICLPLYNNDADIGFLLCDSIESSPVFLETIRSSFCGIFQMMDMVAKEREYGVVLEKKVQERTAELEQAFKEVSLLNGRLEVLSLRDELTGLLNRRGFLSMASRYLSLAERNKSAFVCLFFDLDKLKFINDTYGHANGDIAIKSMANILAATFRKTDVIGRMGGDEFTVLAFECSPPGYDVILKRIDAAVSEYNKTSGYPWTLAYSSGIALSDQDHGFRIETLLNMADNALYKVKSDKKAKTL